jgi:hypothetical protein
MRLEMLCSNKRLSLYMYESKSIDPAQMMLQNVVRERQEPPGHTDHSSPRDLFETNRGAFSLADQIPQIAIIRS